MRKIALLVGISDYEEGLEALPSAVKDVAALQQVLVNPDMGGFAAADVTVLTNPHRQAMADAIHDLFANRKKDDLVLLYFSGHGILDEANEFYFSTRITRKDQGKLKPTTALPANDIRGWMEASRSQRKVIILDSCFSGAFAKGVKAKDSGSVNPEQFLGGQGTAILTASTSTQYALTQDGFDLSIYTHYLVEGIRTGGADRDNDGTISVEELHNYAKEKVMAAAPAMTPEFYPFRDGGHRIVLAKSPKDDPQLRYRQAVEQKVHQGKFSIPARRFLNALQGSLPIGPDIAAAIEAEVLKPYEAFHRKLREYEDTLMQTVLEEAVLDERVLSDLKDYQTHLGLRDGDLADIADRVWAFCQSCDRDVTSQIYRGLQAKDVETFLSRILSPQPVADAGQRPATAQPEPPSKPFKPNSTTPLLPSAPPTIKPPLQQAAPTFEFETATIDRDLKITRRQGRAGFFREALGNGVDLDLVKIPAGQFMMGVTDQEKRAEPNEYPQHQVTVPAFHVGKYPVTQAQWAAIAALPKIKHDLKPDPSNFKGADRPVEKISWWEAVEFCDRLSKKTDRTYRLPSEAEWEYACRSGTPTPFHFGETITPDLANYNGNYAYGAGQKGQYRQQTSPVGQFPANGFGLHDLHGSIWEWCFDHWHETYQGAPQDGSAWITDDNDAKRLMRGGSWDCSPVSCRTAHRIQLEPTRRGRYFGFRVACDFPSDPLLENF
jgi:formylglycine-generating enzyme required for sulfatase activity